MCAKHIGFLIKPASSACNMRCRYCFYCDVAAHREERRARVMGWDVADAIIERALAVAPDAHVAFAFQGGEPTLAGLDFFRSFVARVEERRESQQVSWALQTNGYLIDEEWAAFFREHGFLIGVSVDAYRDLHDSMRPDAHGAATYARVMGGVRLLREAGVDVNVLSVLTSQMAAHPQRVFSFIKQERSRTSSSSRACPASTTSMTLSRLPRGSSRPSIVACSTCGGASWEPGAM